MTPKIVLESLVKRLEGSDADWGRLRGYWADEPAELRERILAGRGHLASALRIARRALASGDEKLIAQAALLAPPLERQGREMANRHLIARRRQNGGNTRGTDQAAAADERWRPWKARLAQLVATGVQPDRAFVKIEREMRAADFTVPGKNGPAFPSDRSLRDRLLK